MFTFFSVTSLTDGVITLRLEECVPMKAGEWAPSYNFLNYLGNVPIGHIHLRIGTNEFVYYGGNIGYGVREPYRGHGYAARACLLVPPIARAHGMEELIITCAPDNVASIRTIEHIGAHFDGVVSIPRWSELRDRGIKFINRYVWDISGFEPGVYGETGGSACEVCR